MTERRWIYNLNLAMKNYFIPALCVCVISVAVAIIVLNPFFDKGNFESKLESNDSKVKSSSPLSTKKIKIIPDVAEARAKNDEIHIDSESPKEKEVFSPTYDFYEQNYVSVVKQSFNEDIASGLDLNEYEQQTVSKLVDVKLREDINSFARLDLLIKENADLLTAAESSLSVEDIIRKQELFDEIDDIHASYEEKRQELETAISDTLSYTKLDEFRRLEKQKYVDQRGERIDGFIDFIGKRVDGYKPYQETQMRSIANRYKAQSAENYRLGSTIILEQLGAQHPDVAELDTLMQTDVFTFLTKEQLDTLEN